MKKIGIGLASLGLAAGTLVASPPAHATRCQYSTEFLCEMQTRLAELGPTRAEFGTMRDLLPTYSGDAESLRQYMCTRFANGYSYESTQTQLITDWIYGNLAPGSGIFEANQGAAQALLAVLATSLTRTPAYCQTPNPSGAGNPSGASTGKVKCLNKKTFAKRYFPAKKCPAGWVKI